jgi:hypothetical protein
MHVLALWEFKQQIPKVTEWPHTKKLGAITACNTHQLPLASWVILKVRSNIVHLSVKNGPRIIKFIVLLEHRRWYTHQGVNALKFAVNDGREDRTRLLVNHSQKTSMLPSLVDHIQEQVQPFPVSLKV